jgi:radical SAM superfamily enzyme YgiQ (UPF0313 family)
MKVCIANGPAYYREFPNRHFIQSGSRWSFSMDLPPGHDRNHYQPYPFNLAYLSSELKSEKTPLSFDIFKEKWQTLEIHAFDACAKDMTDEEFKEMIFKMEPDILFVEVPTVSWTPTMRVLSEINEEMKQCKIIVGGTHVMARPQDLPWYGKAHKIEHSASMNQYFPDRDAFPIEDYHDFEFHKPTAQMLTSWGCPSSCSFCVARHVLYGSPKYMRRNAEKVVDEMELCKEKYGAKQVYFDDDTMTIMPKHVEAICNEILDRKLDMPWTCMGDVTVSPKTLVKMVEAGLIGVKFGVETVSRKTLKYVGKTIMKSALPTEQVRKFVKSCRALGVWTHATYMIGLPGDTREDIEATIKFAVDLGSDSCQFSIATPFPGTPFFRECEEKGWLTTRDWTRYDGARYAVVNYPWLSNLEIEELFQKAMAVRKEHKLSMRDKVK